MQVACWLDVAACVAHALCRLMQINMAVLEVHLQSYMLHACTAFELASHLHLLLTSSSQLAGNRLTFSSTAVV